MAIFIGVFGALIGSFLNVVIYRVPMKKSIVSPPSACGSCGHRVRGYDNIPLISWLVLGGKCRDCGSRISARYPLVELGGAVFFAVVALWFIPAITTSPTLAIAISHTLVLVAFLYLAAISLALALIDLDTRTLPNAIVLPAYGVGAVLFVIASLVSGDYSGLLPALIGATAAGLLYFLLFVSTSGGMGFGDVKLAGVLGLFLGYLGWGQLATGIFGAFLFGGIFGIAVLLSGRGTRKTKVPFGPWMLGGAWFGILVGPEIASWYLALFGLGAS